MRVSDCAERVLSDVSMRCGAVCLRVRDACVCEVVDAGLLVGPSAGVRAMRMRVAMS